MHGFEDFVCRNNKTRRACYSEQPAPLYISQRDHHLRWLQEDAEKAFNGSRDGEAKVDSRVDDEGRELNEVTINRAEVQSSGCWCFPPCISQTKGDRVKRV